MGFGSYQSAWSWLHKIRKAMVRPERTPLALRVEADETYAGGPRPGKPGRGAGGKSKVVGAVESGRGQARGRRLGRLRLAVAPDVSARSLEGFLAAAVAKPATIATDGWSGYGGLAAAGYAHEPLALAASWGDAALRLPAIHLVSASPSAGCSAPTTARSRPSTCPPISRIRLPLQPRTAKNLSHRFARVIQQQSEPGPNLPHHRRCHRLLKVVESWSACEGLRFAELHSGIKA